MKIATIKDFAGMEENGVWYLEGMRARKIAGKSVLSPYYYNRHIASEDTTLFTDLGNIMGGDSFTILHAVPDVVGISSSGVIHSWNQLTSTYNLGKLHSGTAAVAYPDLKITKKNSILYTTDGYLGIGYHGTATAASATTTIIDTLGRNWDTLGIGTTAGINKVINLDSKVEYTITSTTTTTATKDTLNFTANGANANASDQFIVFSDKGANNGGAFWDFFTGAAYPHFIGQPAQANWSRQIVSFSSGSTGRYLITNGNYLSTLSNDETTWNATYKQLPDNVQAYSVATNGAYILIGGEKNNTGKLMLWDDFTTGFLSILDLPGIPTSITAFGSGFLFLMGTEIYYTDGYSTKLICKVMDNEKIGAIVNKSANALKAIGNRIFLNCASNGLLRDRSGVWVYDIGSGWTVVPFTADTTTVSTINPMYGVTGGGLIISGAYGITNTVYSSFATTDTPHLNNINKLVENSNYRSEAVVMLPMLRPTNVKKVILGLLASSNFYPSGTDDSITVKVAISSGRNVNFRYTQLGASATTTSLPNPNGASFFFRGNVGDEVRTLDYNVPGQVTWITAVADAGTAQEVWTVSPALSAAPAQYTNVSIWPFKLVDTKTITFSNLPDNIEFDVEGVYGETFFIQVIIESTSGYAVDINYLDLYA